MITDGAVSGLNGLPLGELTLAVQRISGAMASILLQPTAAPSTEDTSATNQAQGTHGQEQEQEQEKESEDLEQQ